MTIRRRPLSNQSGRMLLIAVLLGVALVIGVGISVFLTRTATLHQTIGTQRSKAGSVIDQGIAYAIKRLSVDQATWNKALAGDFPADCNSPNVVNTPSGNHFKLYCSTGPAGNLFPDSGDFFGAPMHIKMPSYDVAVTAVATLPRGASEVP